MTHKICSCGRHFNTSPTRDRVNKCFYCQHNINRTPNRIYAVLHDPSGRYTGKSFDRYEITDLRKSGLISEGTVFLRTSRGGRKQNYKIENGELVYQPVSRNKKFCIEELERIYEWIKANQPIRQYQLAQFAYGKSANVDNILDALDRNGLMTCEDKGLISAIEF